jgi:transposase
METTPERKSFQDMKEKLEIHKTSGVVGVDIAKSKHFAVILDPVGQTIQPPFSFENTREGFDRLVDRVREAEATPGVSHLI